jgi:hypothetical protein
MMVNIKIPYEPPHNTSPAFEIMLLVLLTIAVLIWFRG